MDGPRELPPNDFPCRHGPSCGERAHSMEERMHRTVAVLVAAALLAVPGVGRADTARCTKTLGKAVARYLKARQRAIADCENKRSSGRLAASTVCRPQCSSGADNPGAPCRNDADCPSGTCQPVDDAVTNDRIDDAIAAATVKITRDCGTLPPLGPACDGSADAAALAACITGPLQEADNDTLNADTLMRSVYGSPAPVDPSLVECQAAIGK